MWTNEPSDRDELIALCEAAIVPMDRWHDRDSAHSHEGIGRAWALLKAGAPFKVRAEPEYDGDRCITDDDTVWVDIEWHGFQWFEIGDELDHDTFYIPTRARLERTAGRDWY